MPEKSRFTCSHEGCNEGPMTTGTAIYRISPKGGPFVGLCLRHYEGERDPIEVVITQDNQRQKADLN